MNCNDPFFFGTVNHLFKYVRLSARNIHGARFMELLATTPWATIKEALAITNIEDFSPGAIRAFLDLEQGGVSRYQTMDEAQLTEYFGEFWPTTKAFKMQGGPDEKFWKFSGFFGLYALSCD
jgi:hypothetical protein